MVRREAIHQNHPKRMAYVSVTEQRKCHKHFVTYCAVTKRRFFGEIHFLVLNYGVLKNGKYFSLSNNGRVAGLIITIVFEWPPKIGEFDHTLGGS